MVMEMSEEEVNAKLAAMMAADDDDFPPPQAQPAISAPILSAPAHTPPASAPAQPVLDDDEALLRAMDDDWDGSIARENPVPSMSAVGPCGATSTNSMGYLQMPDAAAAALLPSAPLQPSLAEPEASVNNADLYVSLNS